MTKKTRTVALVGGPLDGQTTTLPDMGIPFEDLKRHSQVFKKTDTGIHWYRYTSPTTAQFNKTTQPRPK